MLGIISINLSTLIYLTLRIAKILIQFRYEVIDVLRD